MISRILIMQLCFTEIMEFINIWFDYVQVIVEYRSTAGFR